MRITSRGRVTIPVSVRRALGWETGTEVEVEIAHGYARIREVVDVRVRKERARAAIAALRGSATTGFTTDEILQWTRGEE